jgi:hypothetical protein
MKSAKKRKHKLLKILLLVILILLSSLFVSTLILFKTDYGQKKTGKLVARYLSTYLDTRVEIHAAKFSFSDVNFDKVQIFDNKDSLMIECPVLRIKYQNFRQIPGELHFKQMSSRHAYVNFVRHDTSELFNFQYVVEHIRANQKEGKSNRIFIDKILLDSSVMRYYQPPLGEVHGKMNHFDLYFSDLNIFMSDMEIFGSRVESYIDSAFFKDKSGLALHHVDGDFVTDTNELSLYNMSFFPGKSEFYGDFGFHFSSMADFADFNNLVQIKSDLHDSRLCINDLIYFADSIKTHEKEVFIDGQVQGEVVDLRSKNLELKFGDASIYRGSARLTGLPDIRETFLDFNISDFDILFSDIHSLIPRISFPEYFYESDQLNFKGRFTGFVNDFVAYGQLNTALGKLETDLSFKIPVNEKVPDYSGNISLHDFELGKFLGKDSLLGKVDMSGSVVGHGLKMDNIHAQIDAKANYIDFNQYRYRDLTFDGLLTNKLFKGGVVIADNNLQMDFNGSIDLSQNKPYYKFKADIKHSNLHALNFLTDKLLLSCMMEFDLQANNLDDAEGRVIMLDADLQTMNEDYAISTLLLEADYNFGLKEIHLKSELAEADVTGIFSYSRIPDLFLHIISDYFDPSLFPKPRLLNGDEFITFSVKLHNTSFINKLVRSKVVFDNNSSIKGELSNAGKDVRLITSIPGLHVKDMHFNKLFINASKDKGNLVVYSSFGQVLNKDSLLAENLNMSASSNPDKLNFNVYFYNKRFQNHISLFGDALLRKDSFNLVLNNSYFLGQNNMKWDIRSDTIRVNYDPVIDIPSLEISHGDNSIKAYGVISKKGDKPLRVILENTDFAVIEPYIPRKLDDFSGVLNGQLVIYDLLGQLYFDAAILSNPFYFRGQELGILSLSSNHDIQSANTNIQASLYSSDLDDILDVNGYIDFIEEKALDLVVEIPQTDAHYFQPFVDNLVKDLGGELNGDLRFKGPLTNYSVSGSAHFYKTAFTLGYTKVRYTLSNDFVKINEKSINLNQIAFRDDFGNKGLFFGEVKHNYFQDFELRIGVLAENLLGIHTTEKDNSIYYGDAFVTGRLDILGPLDAIKMDMKLKSEDQTDFKLIAYDDNSFSNYNFIKFTNVNNQSRPLYVESSNGISLNLDMEITPDADIQIIFDPLTNDIISANGNGLLKLQVDDLGNTNMFGTFYIEKGEYTFVALDLLKRKFSVKKGSEITWMGDPFQAEANIEAVYKVDASVYNLIKNSEYLTDEKKAPFKQKTFPVEAKLLLTESLFAPTVNLDFEILQTSSMSGSEQSLILDQQVRNIKSDEQELNKQVISLLVLNGFLPPETGIVSESSFENSLNANVGSLFSTQISQWLSGLSSNLGSKYINNFQFGVNWVAENQEYQREFDLIASGNLLNDRIELSGSYDVENVNADFQVNYQPFKGRNLRLKVFSRTDNNPVYQEDIKRQGFGVYIKREFDTWGELFRKNKEELQYQ